MKSTRSRLAWLALVLAGCGQSAIDLRSDVATVVLFTAVDCPIANSYAPELASIARDFPTLRFCLVHVDPTVSMERAQSHAREYSLPGEILVDPQHNLCRQLGAVATPEAFVLLPDGAIAYRGRIDDAWHDLGQRRRVVTSHELRDALSAVTTGQLPAVRQTKPIGCVIE